jgi:hypothetical protein
MAERLEESFCGDSFLAKLAWCQHTALFMTAVLRHSKTRRPTRREVEAAKDAHMTLGSIDWKTYLQLDKLRFYAALKMPEIWLWIRQASGLITYALEKERYKRVRKSRLLPDFDLKVASELGIVSLTSPICETVSQACAGG